MQTIGERLEEARKRKGISIREAAEATKIRSDYLQKFEANSFDIDLPALYLRGFLRTYAKFLELDADRLNQDLGTAIAAEGRAPRRDTREVFGRVDFGEAGPRAGETSEAGTAGGRSGPDQAVLLKYGLFALAAVVVIVVVVVLINVLSSPKPATPATVPAQVIETRPPVTPAEPAQVLTISAAETTRAKVVQGGDGRVLFDGALAGGETRSFPKTGRLVITVEDRTKLRIEVNGRRYEIPRLAGGNYGQFALD